MKPLYPTRTLTFGEFVTSVYDLHGKQKARAKVSLAVNAHQVRFLGLHRFVIANSPS